MNRSSRLFHLFSFFACGLALILLSGCMQTGRELWADMSLLKNDLKVWNTTPGYQGIQYSPTDKVVLTFQDRQVPVSCRVFAHLLVHIPDGFTGKALAQAVEAEAVMRGADMLLIGGTRQANKDKGPAFSYYGPVQPYKCRDHWNGWKFAYEDWVDQGEWVAMGYNEWGNSALHFKTPLIVQAAFLRCPK